MYKQLLELNDRVAVVIGGGRNIGLAISQALGEFGATIVVADRDIEIANSGVQHLEGLNIKCEAMTLDVTDSAKVAEVQLHSLIPLI